LVQCESFLLCITIHLPGCKKEYLNCITGGAKGLEEQGALICQQFSGNTGDNGHSLYAKPGAPDSQQ